ncbi:MAG: TraR/DksA family transcriptional regulator [Pseudomonadota bacterium]
MGQILVVRCTACPRQDAQLSERKQNGYQPTEKRLHRRQEKLLGGPGDAERALEKSGPRGLEVRAFGQHGDDVLEAIGRVDQKALRRIGGALARIEDGTCGMCLACSCEVSFERLQAVPEASLCCSCI